MYINAHGAPNKLSVGNCTNYAKLKKLIVSNVGTFGTYHHILCVDRAYNRHEYEILNITKKHKNSLFVLSYNSEMRDIY